MFLSYRKAGHSFVKEYGAYICIYFAYIYILTWIAEWRFAYIFDRFMDPDLHF